VLVGVARIARAAALAALAPGTGGCPLARLGGLPGYGCCSRLALLAAARRGLAGTCRTRGLLGGRGRFRRLIALSVCAGLRAGVGSGIGAAPAKRRAQLAARATRRLCWQIGRAHV